MMSAANFSFSTRMKVVVNRLADGFLPLADWVRTKKYVPDPTVPWRKENSLSAETLAFAEFLEMILRETSWNSDLKSRWDNFAADPLGRCPIANVDEWRANRGLAANPAFAITSSDILVGDVETREISRLDFYRPYWPLLNDAYSAADATAAATGTPVDEAKFAKDLYTDSNAYWPEPVNWPSGRFCKQFVKDVLYCYLGLRGLADAPYAEAVLLELGEVRRVGNRYTSQDAANAVTLFRAVLKDVYEQGTAHPLAEPGRKLNSQPIGSPAVNARDL
jgi:hypothetical protein